MLSGGTKVYSEVEGMQLLLQYKVGHEREENMLYLYIRGKPERDAWVSDH